MFTFGREHEKKCEAQHVRDPNQVPLLMAVVDSVHDLIEGKGSEEGFRSAVRKAFIDGGCGVWESTSSWLRQVAKEYPNVLPLYSEFASNPKAEVRFRTACILNEMPKEYIAKLSDILVNDRSKKVATMARARIDEIKNSQAT